MNSETLFCNIIFSKKPYFHENGENLLRNYAKLTNSYRCDHVHVSLLNFLSYFVQSRWLSGYLHLTKKEEEGHSFSLPCVTQYFDPKQDSGARIPSSIFGKIHEWNSPLCFSLYFFFKSVLLFVMGLRQYFAQKFKMQETQSVFSLFWMIFHENFHENLFYLHNDAVSNPKLRWTTENLASKMYQLNSVRKTVSACRSRRHRCFWWGCWDLGWRKTWSFGIATNRFRKRHREDPRSTSSLWWFRVGFRLSSRFL